MCSHGDVRCTQGYVRCTQSGDILGVPWGMLGVLTNQG